LRLRECGVGLEATEGQEEKELQGKETDIFGSVAEQPPSAKKMKT